MPRLQCKSTATRTPLPSRRPHRHPFGIHMLDCQNGIDRINPLNPAEAYRLGRICVGQGGHAACGFSSPVEARTWGAIKATYQ